MTCSYCGFIPKDQSGYEQHINRFHRGEEVKNIFGESVNENGGRKILETKVEKQIRR